MIRAYIIQYAPIAIIILVGIFALVKLSVINLYGLREDPMRLYIESHRIYSRQVIKNTFHKARQQYYALSNKLNKLFYAGFICILLLYIFLSV